MRNSVLWLASALAVLLVCTANSTAQPPGGRGRGPDGPPDRRGGPGGGPGGGPPGGGLVRALDEMRLSEGKREAALTAVRAHQDNVGRLTDLSGAALLLKMKDILSEDEYKKVKEATDKARDSRRLSTDAVVERILSFDKNKDGKITIDELPERMQYLIEKGDTNKDGVLDNEEIKALATQMAKEGTSLADAPGGGGRGGRGGRGPGGSGLTLAMVERAVDDLKLAEGKKETAAAAVKAQKEDLRKLTTLVRADLLVQVSDVLSDEEMTKFKVALDREPNLGERPLGRDGPRPGGRPPRP
jgi:EF hand